MSKYSYAIIGDMTCDLSPEIRERFELDGYLKGRYSSPTQDDIEGSLELSENQLEAFYDHLKKNKKGYKTSPDSVDEMAAYFETFLIKGQDILLIAVSSRASAAYNIMLNAKGLLFEKYPDRKIIVIDSLKFSAAIGLLTIKACQLRAEGLPLEQAAEKIESIKMTVHQMGSMDDLFWVASKGRISHTKALFGTIGGIKPLADFDSNGMVTVLGKVSGYDKAYKASIEYMKKTIKGQNEQFIVITHSNRKKQAEMFAGLIKEKIKPKEILMTNVYPMCGINCGPGMVAAYYFGTEITDLKFEKEVMAEILANKL